MKKMNKTARKYAIPVLIIAVVAGVFVVRARQAAKALPGIPAGVVQRGAVVASVSGNGVLEPLTTVEVRSNVGGQIVELAVDEGDEVKAGQLIAKIDPSDSVSALQQAMADYASANAKVAQSKQALNLQKAQTASSIESAEQAVEASRQRLAQTEQEAQVQPKLTSEAISQAQSALDSAEANLKQTESALVPQMLASARASYDQAKASYDESEKTLARDKALLAKGFVAQSQVDSDVAQFAVAKAQLESAKSKRDTIKEQSEQDLRNARSKVSQAKSALAAAKANRVQDTIKARELAAAKASLKQSIAALASARASSYQDQMKGADILQAKASLEKSQAALDNARTQLGYTTVVAPSSGIVVKKYVEKGSIVAAGRQAIGGDGTGITLVEIADTSRMQVVADVDETDVGKIEIGQEVDVEVDACPDELFPAKVTKIAPKAEVNQNVTTVPVTVELEGTDPRLKPEMNATCQFVIDRREDVLYVPIEVISETDSGAQVMVIDHGQQVARKVEVGLYGDDFCEIVKGLKAGETLVVPRTQSSVKDSSKKTSGGGPPPPPM